MRALIAEDDAVSRRLLEITLKQWGYEVVVTRDGNEAWDALQAPDAPRLLVLDWMMPGMSGVEICDRLRKDDNAQFRYTLLLTVKGEKEDIVKGLEAGADDYVSKPFDPAELKARLHVGVRLLELQEELEERLEELEAANLKLHDLSSLDGLTGIPNRRYFDREIRREWRRAMREKTPVGLVMIDIDYFKAYNDSLGHLVGDDCLKRVADGLTDLIKRGGDTIVRFGGEEFTALLPRLDIEGTRAVAERMRLGIEALGIPHSDSTVADHVTISLGAASMRPSPGDLESKLVAAADKALYQAKADGRNCVREASATEKA